MATSDDVYNLLLQFITQGVGFTYDLASYSPSPTTSHYTGDGFYNANTDLTYLVNSMGAIPSGGVHQIYNWMGPVYTDVEDPSHGLAAINANVLTNLTTLNNHDTRMTNYYDLVDESLENAEAQATTAATNSQNLVDNGGQIVMNQAGISLPKFGGGTALISLVQLLASLISSPPINLLTQHLETVFYGSYSLTAAVGIYGATLSLSVPTTWGRTDGPPVRFIPALGRYQWITPDGAYDDPVAITTNTATFFPAPNTATGLVIYLEPGVQGTLYSLRLV